MYHPRVRRLLLLLTPLACNRAGPLATTDDLMLGTTHADEPSSTSTTDLDLTTAAPSDTTGITGGDAFDLADLGLTKARFVRLLDLSVACHGSRMGCGGGGGGFDLDAIAVVHGTRP